MIRRYSHDSTKWFVHKTFLFDSMKDHLFEPVRERLVLTTCASNEGSGETAQSHQSLHCLQTNRRDVDE